MDTAIYMGEKKFREIKVTSEEELERTIRANHRVLFGPQSIYFDLKNKIDSRALGSVIPDAFLFDFRDRENPEFYLVEIELGKHDFYKHIFPQVTKFFAFFKDSHSRDGLVEKLFHYIKSDSQLEQLFKSHLDKKEIYKAVKDILETSQNILLILDEEKPELDEIFRTYTDTWDKMVTVEILKQYESDGQAILTLTPDFEELGLGLTQETGEGTYSENFHIEDTERDIVQAYERIKNAILGLDPEVKINPQKYYLSLRKNKNFAFMKFRRKYMMIIIMLPFETGNSIIKKHKLTQLSQSVQDFYNGPCFRVTLEDGKDLDEIINVLKEAYSQSK